MGHNDIQLFCNYSAHHRNKEAKGIYLNISPRKNTEEHGNMTSKAFIFSCSSVDSVANGVFSDDILWIDVIYL